VMLLFRDDKSDRSIFVASTLVFVAWWYSKGHG